jgi:ABC-type Zn uptake system ZnuABC Zn-binding protein ZnuA/ABC-type Mn2+/Zn2+ transport system permease subunit
MFLRRGRFVGEDAATALALAGCLAVGVILASDVFHSGSEIDTLLFGSLLVITGHDLVVAGVAAIAVLAATVVTGRRWLAVGFDRDAARAFGTSPSTYDAVLLALIAIATTAALAATGAVLVSALFVVPAATARLLTSRLRTLQVTSVALAAAEGAAGLWLSVRTNAPPGATIAVLAGGTFGVVAVARVLVDRARVAGAVAVSAVAVATLGSGCGISTGNGTGGHAAIKVVATTTQIADLVRNVGGAYVDVDQILEPNTDPHEYEPRPSDVENSADAKLAFASGDNLDSWLGSVIDESGSGAKVVDLGATLPVKLPGESTGTEASKYDPHWWHDPRNAEAAVRTIAARLEDADPRHAKDYKAAARAYIAKLRALDRGIAKCMNSVPAGRRKLVTDHDAFSYFANRYGIDVVGAVIPSQTTQAQPSAKQVADLVDLIRAEHVRAVFPESSINPKLAQSIAQETGARSDYTLYGDTLGPSGSPGATYLQMEQANADAMVRGFTNGARGCMIAGIR